MDFLRKNKKVFVWIVVIICILLMLLTVGNRFSPTYFGNIISAPLNLINNIQDWSSNIVVGHQEVQDIKEENEMLEEENMDLSIENDALHMLEEENKELAALLETSESYPNYEKITCDVIGKDFSNWYDTFVIDSGSKDGIKENMVVIAAGGLVGHIVEVSPDYSVVESIIDDTSSVSGIITRTGSLGFVKGDNTMREEGFLRMEFFDVDAEVLPQDEVVTSHLSDIYPFGIQIGTVDSVYTDETGLFKYANITPNVDFKNIKKVIVLLEDFSKDYKEQLDSY